MAILAGVRKHNDKKDTMTKIIRRINLLKF